MAKGSAGDTQPRGLLECRRPTPQDDASAKSVRDGPTPQRHIRFRSLRTSRRRCPWLKLTRLPTLCMQWTHRQRTARFSRHGPAPCEDDCECFLSSALRGNETASAMNAADACGCFLSCGPLECRRPMPQDDASAKNVRDGPTPQRHVRFRSVRTSPQRRPLLKPTRPPRPFAGDGGINGAQPDFRRGSALSRTKKTSPSRTLSRPPPQRSIFTAHHTQAATEDALRWAAVTGARSQARQPFLHRNFGHASVLSTNANKCKVKNFTKADFAKAKKIGIMPP